MSRPSAFPDIAPVLDEALRCGGGVYVCKDHGSAVAFRHRCYKFRKAYFEAFGNAKYDALKFPRIGADSNEVVIELAEPSGTFVPRRSNAPLEPMTVDEAAEALRRKIEKGDVI